jgi:predicted nucleic acid-binding protein
MAAVASSIFFDTNVLVYRHDEGEPEKREVAERWYAEVSGAGRLVISTQVLQEVYSVLTRGPLPIVAADAAERLVRKYAAGTVVQIDPSLILTGIVVSQRSRVSFWDGLVIAAAQNAGCTVLLTEDLNHGQRFGDLVVENPFKDVKRRRRR